MPSKGPRGTLPGWMVLPGRGKAGPSRFWPSRSLTIQLHLPRASQSPTRGNHFQPQSGLCSLPCLSGLQCSLRVHHLVALMGTACRVSQKLLSHTWPLLGRIMRPTKRLFKPATLFLLNNIIGRSIHAEQIIVSNNTQRERGPAQQ